MGVAAVPRGLAGEALRPRVLIGDRPRRESARPPAISLSDFLMVGVFRIVAVVEKTEIRFASSLPRFEQPPPRTSGGLRACLHVVTVTVRPSNATTSYQVVSPSKKSSLSLPSFPVFVHAASLGH